MSERFWTTTAMPTLKGLGNSVVGFARWSWSQRLDGTVGCTTGRVADDKHPLVAEVNVAEQPVVQAIRFALHAAMLAAGGSVAPCH